MRLLLVLFCLFSVSPVSHLLAQTTLLQGKVLDDKTQEPIPFASVGIAGQPFGTVANAQGQFQFTIPAPSSKATEAVLISCVGYQTATVPTATLQAAGQVVRLHPSSINLAAVTVRPGKVKTKTFGRTSSSTLMGASMYTEADLVSDALAKEQGTILPVDEDCRLRDFNMHVAFNRFKSIKFRLNLYSVQAGRPHQPLLRQDIRFDVTQPRGWVRVDLTPYQVQVQGHKAVAVTIQWLESEATPGNSKSFGISAVPMLGHSILTRSKSQAQWQELTPGYLSMYLTLDSYRPLPNKALEAGKASLATGNQGLQQGQPASAPADDYQLPDSLRYLRYVTASSTPTLTNPAGYGQHPTAGHFVQLPGTRLYYERYGQGAPLLLLHGNGQSIAAFQEQIGELAQHYDVLAVDTRAHGRSLDSTTASLTYNLFAADVKQLLDSLHLSKVNVVGWSDGGNTALALALLYPASLNRMVVMGANLFPTAEAVEPDFLQLLRKQLREAQRLPGAHSKQDARRLQLLLQEPNMTFQELHAITTPTLVVAGQHDLILEKHTRAIAQHIPGAQLLIMPGASHYAPQEKPREFNQAVLQFFQK
ncbi:alpha/beta fold hydrolase [Hymenobacter sp. AT01-02]|uniref:alpha/beta fold hydrolase n=1 Tax=Hymenobacter sp. AT01-02 TaxID=1571877 RepID=UPI000698710B|nr:alpha/beta fold hydrolase [Hymenobacter sp. AT01-02]